MSTYTQLLDVSGNPRIDLVQRDDGALVLTGQIAGLNGTMDVPDFADPDGLAYQAWVKAGGVLGAPALDLRAYAAQARYAKETASITVGTARIATDRDSQAMITGMWAAAQINPNISVSFKSGSGFVTIGAAQVAKIAAAVASYVQACFTAEAGVVQGIAAGTVKATGDVDAAFAAVVSIFPSTASAATSGPSS